jgi:two-component system cell cycle sensor histidine kinase/response regulator CckA
MDAIGTLAGGIAHDFNNILTAIGINAQLAALDVPPGPAADSLASVQRACGRARDLVRRILLFSQRQKSSPQLMDPGPVTEEAIELLRAAIAPSVVIRMHAASGLPQVNVDPAQLHQVMMNLGTNAAYAMREQGGTLTIAIDAVVHDGGGPLQLDPGRYLRLTVADTGVGMTPEVRERLFEPFFTTKGQAGTGLGLSIVHGIIQDHGGAITVTSEVGNGTTFEIHLPADGGDETACMRMIPEVPRGANQHIMYVDDEEIICHAMTRILIRLGYRCTGFTDPAAAIHEFRGAPQAFDAVITDLQMPGMSGLDVVRAVREARPDIPVVIASGYPSHGIASDPDARSISWMTKPATLEEIATTVHEVLASPAGGANGPATA